MPSAFLSYSWDPEPDAAPSWLLGSYYVDLRGELWDSKYSLLLDTLQHRLPEPPPVKVQGFRVLPDKTVLDTTSGLVWANCRNSNAIALDDLDQAIARISQESGWTWRLPTHDEVNAVKEAEEYYLRPPILVEVSNDHPFFGKYEKSSWTDTLISNVKSGDSAGHAGNVFDANRFAGVWSGLAGALNVNSFHIAQEAEYIRRRFHLRFVRQASDEDFRSSAAN